MGQAAARTEDAITRARQEVDALVETIEQTRRENLLSGGRQAAALARLEERLQAARADLQVAENALVEAEDAQAAAESERVKAAHARAVAVVEERTRDMIRLQARLYADLVRLAALREEVAKRTPRRLLSRRSTRFLKCEVLDPVAARLHADVDGNPRPIRVELFKALAGEQRGVWRVLDPVPHDVPPEEIEEAWTDGPLPAELDALCGLDLGEPANLRGEWRPGERYTFQRAAAAVTDQDRAEAARLLDGGK